MEILKTVLKILLSLIKWSFIGLMAIIVLNAFTKGRAFEALLYLSLLSLSIGLSFAVPVSIAFGVAKLYESVDKDPDRSFLIGNTIRGIGLFEGFRNVHSQLHGPNTGHRCMFDNFR